MRNVLFVVAVSLVVAACGPAEVPVDAGVVDAGRSDSGVDAGALDAGQNDAGTFDAGTIDSGTDAGPIVRDAGLVDAGSFDAGSVDAGTRDAGSVDAGPIDSGTIDAGVFDAGTFDPDAGIPAFIVNLAPGNATTIASRVSDAFQSFAGQAGDPIAVFAYSGGAYDTKRARFMLSGGGHNDHNGNGVYGLNLYSSETPVWTLFKPHTTPPSVTDFTTPSIELAPNGDPASSHTYSQIVYDPTTDKLVLCGLGSAAGSTGNNFSRFRFLNLSTNAWEPAAASFQGPSESMFAAAFAYHSMERAIYGRGGGTQGRWFRYDSMADTLTQLTATGGGNVPNSLDSAVAIDPVRSFGVWIGGYGDNGPLDNGSADMVLADFSSRSGTSLPTYARTLTNFPTALRAAKIAVEFHPPSGTFVAWAGGNTIYRLIPPANPFTGTWTFQTITPGGTGLPTIADTSYGKPYSKFRWAPYPNDPARGIFVMAVAQGTSGAYTSSLTYVYKPNF